MAKSVDLADEVQSAWSAFNAARAEEMEYFTIGWGQRVKHLFVGIRPVDVDIDDEDFLTEGPLHDLHPAAAAAYLGPYLRALLLDLAFQEKIGYFTEPMLRSHVIVFLASPTAWPDVLKPYLPVQCKKTLGLVVDYFLASEKLLYISDEQRRSMEKTSRSIKREIG